jgi:hypothetical protein
MKIKIKIICGVYALGLCLSVVHFTKYYIETKEKQSDILNRNIAHVYKKNP